MNKKIIAVVVTFNRLALLKECIDALRNQSVPVDVILVINNSSNDGTLEWLKQQVDIVTINQGNVGGAGGFHTGMKEASMHGADWIWAMDDDTIPMPNALEAMLKKLQFFKVNEVGFLCSKAVWADGQPHLMNLPEINAFANHEHPFSTFDNHNVLLVKSCSFVSILLNAQMVEKFGLPYKEFYIWCDDKEFTNRITKAGLYGIYIPESLVLHKTPANYRVDLYTDTPKNLWKYRYGIRNELFILKRDKGFLYFALFAIAKVLFNTYKILKFRKSDKMAFCKVLINSTIEAFTFNPQIDKV